LKILLLLIFSNYVYYIKVDLCIKNDTCLNKFQNKPYNMQYINSSSISVDASTSTSTSTSTTSSTTTSTKTKTKTIVKIKLFALDVSSLVLKGKFDPYTVTLEKLWQRNHRKSYKACLKRLQASSYDQKFIDAMNLIVSKMQNAKLIDESIDGDDTSVTLNINKILDDINLITEKDLPLNSSCDLQVLKDMAIKQIKEKIQTGRGNKHETSVLDDYEKMTENKVTERNTNRYSKTIIINYNNDTDIELSITGRIDGIDQVNKLIVEAKKRQYKLSYKLRDYENLQVQTYMWLSNIYRTHLTETFNGTSKMYDIYYDEQYWYQWILPNVVSSVVQLVNIILNSDIQDQIMNVNKTLTV
jgi:hypothetical protein